MVEIWKKIKDYNDYEISNLGNVRSLKNNKILKPSKSTSGYLQVVLCEQGKIKSHFIHKLVAIAFLKNNNNYNEINHKDESKINNNVNNLEWCSRKYNMNYGNIKEKQAKAKRKQVAKYNKNGILIKVYNSIDEAAKENNAQSTNIVRCCKHIEHCKTHKGYKWEYIN